MTLEAETALAAGWPIEVTEFALVGDKLADSSWVHEAGNDNQTQHFGALMWGLTEDERLLHRFDLCGTSIPGAVRLSCLRDSEVGRYRDYPEVGMSWSSAALAWQVSPFVGDWLADPLVREEGVRNGVWAITAEGGIMHQGEEDRL